MILENHIHRIKAKELELQKTKQEFLDELKKECTRILNIRQYNRKWRKCLIYVLRQNYPELIQKDIADAIGVNRTDVIIANADVQKWMYVDKCETIIGYVKELENEINN